MFVYCGFWDCFSIQHLNTLPYCTLWSKGLCGSLLNNVISCGFCIRRKTIIFESICAVGWHEMRINLSFRHFRSMKNPPPPSGLSQQARWLMTFMLVSLSSAFLCLDRKEEEWRIETGGSLCLVLLFSIYHLPSLSCLSPAVCVILPLGLPIPTIPHTTHTHTRFGL